MTFQLPKLAVFASAVIFAATACKSTPRAPVHETLATDGTATEWVVFRSDGHAVTQERCRKQSEQVQCLQQSVSVPESILVSQVAREIGTQLQRLSEAEALAARSLKRPRVADSAGGANTTPAEGQNELSAPFSHSEEKQLLSREQASLDDLGDRLQAGMKFSLPLHAPEARQQPFAIRLNDAFARRLPPFISQDGTRWLFASNIEPYVGSELRCQDLFPGSRLPSNAEAKIAVAGGLNESPVALALVPRALRQPRLFWTSTLPDPKVLAAVREKTRDINQWVWAESADPQLGIQGRLMRMERTASLLCVADHFAK
jgi:hypothetical protein